MKLGLEENIEINTFLLSLPGTKTWPLLDLHITLCCRRLSVLCGLPFASTVIWNFLFSNWKTMKITVVPGQSYVAIVDVMSWWKIWRRTQKFVGEMGRKREMRLPCLLMHMICLGVKMEYGLHPNSSDKLSLWIHPWGYLEGPWERQNRNFPIVGLPTKGTWQPSFQFRIIYVSCVWD